MKDEYAMLFLLSSGNASSERADLRGLSKGQKRKFLYDQGDPDHEQKIRTEQGAQNAGPGARFL